MRRSLAGCIVGLAALSCCVILRAQIPATASLEKTSVTGAVDSALVPSGTTLELELQDSLNTRHTKKGDQVSFKVASEVLVDGRVAIPAESGLAATVVAAKRAGLGLQKGELKLAFDRIVLTDGKSLPLTAKLTRVGRWPRSNNITQAGPTDRDSWQDLQAIGQGAFGGALLGAMIGENAKEAATGAAAGAAVGAAFSILEILLQRGPELDLPPGIMFQVELTKSLEVPLIAPGREQSAPPSPQPPAPPHTTEPLAESVSPASNMPEAPLDAGVLPRKVEIDPPDTTTMEAKASTPPPRVAAPPTADPTIAGGESPFKFSVNVNLVMVEATVRDERGAIYIKLKREDFSVLEDGVKQEIRHFSRDELPLAVALVIDRSGSVAPVMDRLRRAAYETLSQLKRDDQVALYSFAEANERIENLTADRQSIADSIATIRAGGGTNIKDALFDAAAYLGREAPARRHAIILISDNQETVGSRASESQVIRTALENESVIYSIRVQDRSTHDMFYPPAPLAGGESVKRITQETGGEIFDTKDLGSVEAAMQAVVSRLKLRFTLGYESTNQRRDGTFRRIEVRLANREPLTRGFKVYARRGYYAAKQGEEASLAKSLNTSPVVARALPLTNPAASVAEHEKVPSASFTNDDVLKLVRAGFGEEIILESIRVNKSYFDTSADALLALKNAGVGEKIILAILAAARIPTDRPAQGSESHALPARSGIYVLKDGGYIPLESEPVEWRSDFFAGTTTLGKRTTTPLRVSLETPQSALRLSSKPEFLLVIPEGIAGIEYHLLRAEHNDRNREFRTDFEVISDGSLIALQGTGNNRVPFTAKRLGAGKFRLELPELAKGEYAFLPLTKGVNGKLYTFGVP